VDFNEHFHIFVEGPKWVPYYYLYFEASLDATKLEQNAPCPLLWNETAAEKICFLIDKQVSAFIKNCIIGNGNIVSIFDHRKF
jgi:hypothetical protein